MTKKDYQAIARAFHAIRTAEVQGFEARRDTTDNALQHWGRLEGMDIALTALCGVLTQDSPRFDRARFIKACETGDMGKPKRIPLCAQAMGCLCAKHARGASVSALCDARE